MSSQSSITNYLSKRAREKCAIDNLSPPPKKKRCDGDECVSTASVLDCSTQQEGVESLDSSQAIGTCDVNEDICTTSSFRIDTVLRNEEIGSVREESTDSIVPEIDEDLKKALYVKGRLTATQVTSLLQSTQCMTFC